MAYTRWEANWQDKPTLTTPIVADFLDALETEVELLDGAHGVVWVDPADTATAGTAINAAMAALPSTGGTIMVPGGAWTMDVPILWNKNGVVLQGASNLATQLIYDPATITAGVIKMADTTQRFGTIRDLLIDPTGVDGGVAIDASYFVSSQFYNIRIGNGSTVPLKGLVLGTAETGTHYNSFRDFTIFVNGVGSVGIELDNESNSNWFQNFRILTDADGIGVRITDTHTTMLAHIDCEGTGLIGVHCNTGAHNTTLLMPYFESIDAGIQLEKGVEGFAVIGGTALDCDSNVNDLGAIDPIYVGMWKQYDTYNRIPEIPFKSERRIVKDAGAATYTAIGLPAPTATATVTSSDDSSGIFANHATTASANNVTGLISAAFVGARRDWESHVDMRIKTGSDITSIRILAGLFDESPDAVPTPATCAGAWFRYDTSVDGTAFWRTVTSDGSATTVTTTTAPIALSTKYHLSIELVESPFRAFFYVDRALVATHDHTDIAPSTSDALGYGIRLTTLSAAVRNIKIGHLRLLND